MAGIGGFETTLGGSSNFTGTATISEIVSINLPEINVTDIDVSSMDSASNFMEFVGGSKDPGSIECTVNYSKALDALMYAAVGDANETWTITFPDSCKWQSNGYVSNFGAGTAGPNEKVTRTFTIKCSGLPTHTTS